MPIRMAVFDLAGTTVLDNNAVYKAFSKAFLQYGHSLSEHDVNKLMGYKKPDAIRQMLTRLGAAATSKHVEEIHESFIEEMLNYYEFSPEVEPLDGAEQTMWALKDKGIRIVVNTGFSREIADAIIERMQWTDMGLLDDSITSDEVLLGRPDPAMINKLMERAGITDPSEVAKIGDTEVDINEGRNAGCSLVIAVTTGAFTRDQLEVYSPDHILDDLTELPQIIFARA